MSQTDLQTDSFRSGYMFSSASQLKLGRSWHLMLHCRHLFVLYFAALFLCYFSAGSESFKTAYIWLRNCVYRWRCLQWVSG